MPSRESFIRWPSVISLPLSKWGVALFFARGGKRLAKALGHFLEADAVRCAQAGHDVFVVAGGGVQRLDFVAWRIRFNALDVVFYVGNVPLARCAIERMGGRTTS